MLKFGVDIIDSLETASFGDVAISVIFSSFYIITFDGNGKFEFVHQKNLNLMVSSERSSSDLSEYTLFQIKKYFSSIKINF